jgi:glycosyltransferase involved in cell wall biosynthesis
MAPGDLPLKAPSERTLPIDREGPVRERGSNHREGLDEKVEPFLARQAPDSDDPRLQRFDLLVVGGRWNGIWDHLNIAQSLGAEEVCAPLSECHYDVGPGIKIPSHRVTEEGKKVKRIVSLFKTGPWIRALADYNAIGSPLRADSEEGKEISFIEEAQETGRLELGDNPPKPAYRTDDSAGFQWNRAIPRMGIEHPDHDPLVQCERSGDRLCRPKSYDDDGGTPIGRTIRNRHERALRSTECESVDDTDEAGGGPLGFVHTPSLNGGCRHLRVSSMSVKPFAAVALILPSFRCGGAERIVAWLANSWVERGRRVVLVTLDGAAVPPFFPLDERVEQHTVQLSSGGLTRRLRAVARLRRLLREHAVVGAITFVTGANVAVPLELLGSGIAVVSAVRDHPTRHRPSFLLRLLRPLALRLSRRVVVQSDLFVGLLSPAVRERAVTVPNPVFPAPESGCPARERKLVCSVGRLVPKKGFGELIAEFALIAPDFPEWDLVIFGAGPERANLEREISERGMGERVYLPGEVSDLPARLRGIDIFVLSSHYEGFPNGLCEAMAAGRAVAARDCPSAIRDIIVPGVNGVIFSSRIAEALPPLMADGALRERLGREARDAAVRFSPQQVLARWEGVLSSAGLTGI